MVKHSLFGLDEDSDVVQHTKTPMEVYQKNKNLWNGVIKTAGAAAKVIVERVKVIANKPFPMIPNNPGV